MRLRRMRMRAKDERSVRNFAPRGFKGRCRVTTADERVDRVGEKIRNGGRFVVLK